MSLNADHFLAQLLSLLPPGKAWAREFWTDIVAILDGCAPEFARVQARADQMLLELNPFKVEEMIDEWEAAWGLPDDCGVTTATTIEQRRAALLAKLQENRGHNPADYEALAELYGHTGTEVYRRPWAPFAAGVGAAGTPAYDDQWTHAYIVQYMTSRIAAPNDFTAWIMSSGVVSIDSDVARAPDGTLTADRLNIGTPPGFIGISSITHSDFDGNDTQLDIWLRTESGMADVELEILGSVSSEGVTELHTIDTAWRHFTVRATTNDDNPVVKIRNKEASAIVLHAWNGRLSAVDANFECKLGHVQQQHGVPIYRSIGDYVG